MAAEPATKQKAKIETTDIMFVMGLLTILAGLGLTVGWGWGLVTDGVILTGTSLWLVAPLPNRGSD